MNEPEWGWKFYHLSGLVVWETSKPQPAGEKCKRGGEHYCCRSRIMSGLKCCVCQPHEGCDLYKPRPVEKDELDKILDLVHYWAHPRERIKANLLAWRDKSVKEALGGKLPVFRQDFDWRKSDR